MTHGDGTRGSVLLPRICLTSAGCYSGCGSQEGVKEKGQLSLHEQVKAAGICAKIDLERHTSGLEVC